MRFVTFKMTISHKNFPDCLLGRNLLLKRKGVIGRICQLLMTIAKEEERELQTSLSSFYFIILYFLIAAAAAASFSIT